VASASHVTIRKRAALLFLFVVVIMVGLIGRLGYLQFFRSSWLTENAMDQRIREIPVEAKRGIIYDRTGRELAVSVSTESVYAIPAEIKNPEETAAKLAAILALGAGKTAGKTANPRDILRTAISRGFYQAAEPAVLSGWAGFCRLQAAAVST
jgi:stage V sporulation protein D (sporulation-specific penicillin-binding protein)